MEWHGTRAIATYRTYIYIPLALTESIQILCESKEIHPVRLLPGRAPLSFQN